MCEYCSRKKNFIDFNYPVPDVVRFKNGVEVSLKGNVLIVYTESIYKEIKANYCLNCGRKLEE